METSPDDPLFKSSERFHLDPSSPVPLYHRIEQVILDRIAAENAVGKRLPSEKDLMVMFGVSRATARKTYENLVAKGLIERRRALGTRVIGREISEDLGRLKSFTEEMQLKGLQVSTELLEARLHIPDPQIALKLNLGPDEQSLQIRRLRGSSEVFPVVLLISEIPGSFGIDPKENFSDSLYGLIEQKYGIPIECADEQISVQKASEEEARLLRIQAGEGVLVMERLTYTRGERPLEFIRAVYHPEHYTFSIRLKR